MNPLVRRIVVRSTLVAAVLAVAGYLFARMMRVILLENAIPKPEHDELWWRVPLTMATAGFAVTALLEGIAAWFRRGKRPQG